MCFKQKHIRNATKPPKESRDDPHVSGEGHEGGCCREQRVNFAAWVGTTSLFSLPFVLKENHVYVGGSKLLFQLDIMTKDVKPHFQKQTCFSHGNE